MLHYVLKVPDAIANCKEIIPSAHYECHLKLCNNAKENFGSRKRAPDDNAVCVSELQSSDVSLLQ